MEIQNTVIVMHHMEKFWLTMGHICSCGPIGFCHLSLVSELCHFSCHCDRNLTVGREGGRKEGRKRGRVRRRGRFTLAHNWRRYISSWWGFRGNMKWSVTLHQDAEKDEGWLTFFFGPVHKTFLPIFRLTLTTSSNVSCNALTDSPRWSQNVLTFYNI